MKLELKKLKKPRAKPNKNKQEVSKFLKESGLKGSVEAE